jgi:hypothetical protein
MLNWVSDLLVIKKQVPLFEGSCGVEISLDSGGNIHISADPEVKFINGAFLNGQK